MPNYVTNAIMFKCREESQADEIAKALGAEPGKPFSFNSLIPEPTSPEGLDGRYIVNEDSHVAQYEDRPWFNWYTWHNDRWGTKWDACDESHSRRESTITPMGRKEFGNPANTHALILVFDTAWAVPDPIIGRIKRNVDVLVAEKGYDPKDIDFCFEWIEEQGIADLGRVTQTGLDSPFDEEIPEPFSKEAKAMMKEFWGCDYDDSEGDFDDGRENGVAEA